MTDARAHALTLGSLRYELRELAPDDAPFVLEMLRLALGWRLVPPADGSPLPVAVPARVFADLGRDGDGGVVARFADEPVGACWYRLVPADRAAGGAVGVGVPQLTLAVAPAHRAHGLGGALLDRTIAQARGAGLAALALSVERDNPARAMYERRGFEPVAEHDGSLTMQLPLDGVT